MDDMQLKKCPWCGKEDDIEIYKVVLNDKKEVYQLRCPRCGCSFRNGTAPNTLEKAIKFWNKMDFGPH